MRLTIFWIVWLFLTGCEPKPELKTGQWRGVIQLQEQELPFGLMIEKNGQAYAAYLQNADESILLDEIDVDGDSVKFDLHIFDATLHARILDQSLTGMFVKNYDPTGSLPFRATYGETHRFAKDASAKVDFSGTYAVTFHDSDTSHYPAVALIQQEANEVIGTFLTATGDYRYLEGNVIDQELKLSTFDGNHAFIFTATKSGDSIRGHFYSGKTGHETWKGVSDPTATLPSEESLTFLKPGFTQLDFSFPDLQGTKISSSDERFKNNVTILQIFGTWCPNCMDETKFLAPWYEQNKDRGVQILGLAYERKDDFNYARERVEKMKAKLKVGYDFVIAGVNDKKKASESLPALNRVLAFPTTIFIGKDGTVKHIHTGFSGPGTGIYYERFKERFNQIVNELLAEPAPQ
jgi:thiol-disulfide isomerase/thioredoxin